ncbi:MAG TPA: hypothetical protein VGP30_08320 [Candidatus Limnocylindrales bacterium]|nr:hypothetical protein [Candidatus Limnocylindrales bacterium]
MHARVTRFKSEPARIDEGVRRIEEKVVPNAKKLAGFKGGYWLVDRKTGEGFSVTLFESEAALQASEEAAKKLRDEATADGPTRITGVERYEVVVQA